MIDEEFKIQVASDLATIKQQVLALTSELPKLMTKDACQAELNKTKGFNSLFSFGTLISVVAIAISLTAAVWQK